MYDQWALQLAPLASQHHLSEYSRLKYGRDGCPVLYAPLSLHLPDVVRGLRERQRKHALSPRESPPSNALADSVPQPQPGHVKTSQTHPINISPIIPPESLLAISAHLTLCKRPFPVLFEIHLPYSLDRIARHPFPSCEDPSTTPLPPTSHHKRLPSNDPRSSVASALNAALNTKLSLPVPSPRILRSLKRNPERDVDPKLAQRQTPPPTTYPFSPYIRLPTLPSPPNKSKSRSSPSSRQKPFKLGNLLLSSCPGKKVRLNGPPRGRSAVCRDLAVDLRRIKLLGARCVVCCLDDDELEFLIGASWPEYCQVAHQEGLDVLRIPLPEGLTPLSPESLDADLDQIIERYTLQGLSVLAHCRGGVGRAGLLACCWMLRLGLCGWIETDIHPSPMTSMPETETDPKRDGETFRWDSDTVIRRDTLQLVERVIQVVRRRRSVKAIETLEQVQFLVEYVDYLRTRARDPGSP